jgi:hypothetical protein
LNDEIRRWGLSKDKIEPGMEFQLPVDISRRIMV